MKNWNNYQKIHNMMPDDDEGTGGGGEGGTGDDGNGEGGGIEPGGNGKRP